MKRKEVEVCLQRAIVLSEDEFKLLVSDLVEVARGEFG